MERTAEDIEMAAQIIDDVLKDAQLHRMPDEDGKSPTYCMGLGDGGTLLSIADALAKYRLGA